MARKTALGPRLLEPWFSALHIRINLGNHFKISMLKPHSEPFKSEFWGWRHSRASYENSKDVSSVQPELETTRLEAKSVRMAAPG